MSKFFSLFPTEIERPGRGELLAVLGVTILGAVLRFAGLWDLPPGLWYDEAIIGLGVLDILRKPGLPIFFMLQGHAEEPLFYYLNLPGFAFGTVSGLTLRMTSAVLGTLTIPAVWWCARETLGPRRALFAVFLFATMRWHIHFSRLSFRTLLAPLFCALITGFLARTARHGRKRDAIAAGVLTGLSLYTYLSMRLFVVVAGASLAAAMLVRFRGRRREALGVIAMWAAAGLVTFAPLGVDYVRHPEHFRARQGEVLEQMNAQRLAMQIRDVSLMYSVRGDHVAKHNIPGPPRFFQGYALGSDTADSMAWWRDVRAGGGEVPDVHGTGLPVFDLLTALVFHCGLLVVVVSAWRRDWTGLHLVLWLGVGSLASVLSFGAPNMLRLLLLTPAVAMVLALAVDSVIQIAEGRLRRAAMVAACLFCGWFAMGEAYRYFVVWRGHPLVWHEFNSAFAEAGTWLRSQPGLPRHVVVPDFIADAPTFVLETDEIRDQVVAERDAGTVAEGSWLLCPEPPMPSLSQVPEETVVVREFRTPEGVVWARIVR